MQVTSLQHASPQQTQETVRQAADALRRGKLVVFPTETVYGIGALATQPEGVAALRKFKNQTDDRPLTVHIASPQIAANYADLSHPTVQRLMRKVMPGPVTVVVDVPESVVEEKMSKLGLPRESWTNIYHQRAVGLRCPDHPLAQRLLAEVDGPVLAASANVPGGAMPLDAPDALKSVGESAAMVLDGGAARYGKPSTMVRVRLNGATPQVSVEQAGVYDERFIRKLLRWTMLLVCSGNTCRSPMAEGLARTLIAQQRGLSVADLETAGVRVLSAGVFAHPGSSASDEAVEAMKRMNVDISRHRSRMLTTEMIHEADVVYCMTRNHLEAVLDMVPSARDKVFLLDANGDIEDPVGAGLTLYLRVAERIRRQLEQRIKEQQS